jgi:hypothetical protein
MVRITTEINVELYKDLMRQASAQRRSTRDQAGWLLEQKISEGRPLLQNSHDSATAPGPEPQRERVPA